MHDELAQFGRNGMWDLVPSPSDANIIGTKWIFRNKTDEHGSTARNKAWLVAQGFSQIEGIDYDETFDPVARLESIRLLLAVSCILNFQLQQMNVKTTFINGLLNEKIYVAQPKGFEDSHFPHYMYKLKKALYGLKQASRAWYEHLTQYLLKMVIGEGERTKFCL